MIAPVETSVGNVRDRFPEATIETDLPASASAYALVELELAITELLENAVRHSESEEPTVRVGAQRSNDVVRIVVDDDGPPIPDIEARVLTGDSEMDHLYHSSGLGLWLVYWIVELSDGSISIDSTETDGNRVAVDLPQEAT